MPRNSTVRYSPNSYRHLKEISINTKQLFIIPSKTSRNRLKSNRRKILGIALAAILVVGVSLAMTIPFTLNLHQKKSDAASTSTSLNPITSNWITNTTILWNSTLIISITTTTTTSTDSTTSITTSSTTTTTTTVSTSTTSSTDSTSTTVSTSTTSTSTSTTTTSNPYACSNMTILNGYDLYGNDLTFKHTANYTLCCEFCLSNSTCKSFTWVKSTGSSPCYLKYAVPSFGNNSNLISAHF